MIVYSYTVSKAFGAWKVNGYEAAITVTDTYRETKSRFGWIGEIENERLLSALEKLSEDDLKLLTLYTYEGYTVTEISKVLGVSQPTISIKIKRITNFLKKFDFDAMDWPFLMARKWRDNFPSGTHRRAKRPTSGTLKTK